jgi:hypothetical protein
MNHAKLLLLISTSLLLQACSGDSEPAAVAETPANSEGSEPAALAETSANRVYIVSPANGSIVTSPVVLRFGIAGYTLAAAGTYEANTGHHHLIIDTPLPALDQPIPSDANHRHFGNAQKSARLELEPGEHTLQLLLGDGNHVPHSTAIISDPIVITVVTEL